MHLIQEIGSYAGLAAIPGIAVLSALYFSQARDVRRLREWAGRAPERAEEQATGGRVVAQPQQAAKPAAAAAATGVQPAVVRQGENGDSQKTAEGQRPAVAKPGALTPAAVASAAAGATKPPAGAAGATGTVTRAGPPAVGAARPATAAGAALPPRRQIPRVPSQTAARVAPREPDPWYRRLANRLPAGRYVALIVAGALVLGGGAAYGITQLASSDSGSKSAHAAKSSNLGPAPTGKSSSKKSKGGAGAIDPSKVTVTVVNGTTIPNLARDTATKLSSLGFQIGNKVTGTGSLAAAESVVEYKPGAEAEARYVAAKLHISQRQPADPDAIAQAGPADVIVVLGANSAPGG
ncbi:MAG TPA: LytR C-terminal domain-containing protein [Thermoleophilaceae bacterium]